MTDTLETSATDQPAVADHRDTPLGDRLRDALDGPFAEVRQRFRAKVSAGELLRDPGQSLEEARDWTLAKTKELAARGIGNQGYPVQGQPADSVAVVASFETLALGDLSLTIKAGVQYGLFGGSIANLGNEWHHDTYLDDVINVALPGCFAMTEKGHGSDVQSLETTITFDADSDEFVVHSPTPTAAKTYIGNAARDGRMAVVFGQLHVGEENHGIHAVLVPIRDEAGHDLPGVTTFDNGHKGGLLGVDNGGMSFEHVRVPRRMLLDRYGGVDELGRYRSPIENRNRRFFTMLGTLVRGRVCVGAGAGIAARRALSIGVRYGERRRQFPAPSAPEGVVLNDYRTHQRRLLPAVAQSYALGFAHNALTVLLGEVTGSAEPEVTALRELETRAAALKVAQTRFANDTVQACREACGGAGFMAENQLTLLRCDVDVFATFEGDNTVLQQLVAKAVLTHYAEQWGALDIRGTVQQTANLVGRTVIERTAARSLIERLVEAAQRRSGEVPILDRGWHAWMFEERERHVLEGLAARMRKARKAPDAESFAAFNDLQDHLVMAARVHNDRLVLEAFIDGIEAVEDAQTKQLLNRLCDLYALANLDDDRGWFQQHHRMSAVRAKQVGRKINELCAELRPHAIALVDGLGVPADSLGAAMLAD